MVVDLSAPILPGVGAAGLSLGTPIAAALEGSAVFRRLAADELDFPLPPGMVRHRSSAVDLWTEDGVLTQIAVHGGYRGTLPGGIGLGATLAELETAAGGPCELIDLSLVVRRLRGVSFETEERSRPGTPGSRDRRIARIYVFPAASDG